MIDHIGIRVSDYPKSKAFYSIVLKTLGHTLIMEVSPEMAGKADYHAGFGSHGKPSFWISSIGRPAVDLHIAFTAKNRAEVDAFYHAAMQAGALDNGAPGLRPMYHPNYYGAFAIDFDGMNIEAVCHFPE